ncbi:putative virion structural protein [Serratia phage vB_SmaM-Kodama]|nr:putative virion structural protein [Serratia phage vB_SmaM-Kodama]
MLKADLEKLSDQQFEELMGQIAAGRPVISATIPNISGITLNNAHFKAIGDKWGVEFFHHLIMTDPETNREFVTPLRYMIVREGVVRLQQMIEDKQSIPDDTTHVDDLTGQVTGPSKGSKLSFVETNNLRGRGFLKVILETISVRGGDEAANLKFEEDIALTGEGSVEVAKEYGSGVTATRNFATILRVAHLDNTLDKGL